MENNNDNVIEDAEKRTLCEKTKKYGSQARNLIITAAIIIIILFITLISFALGYKGGVTSKYTDFYPKTTYLYFDTEINEADIKQINKLSGLNAKNLPDLLDKFFKSTKNNFKSEKINSLIPEIFGDSLSFGLWKQQLRGGTIDRNLAIITLKNKQKVDSLFVKLINKDVKLFQKKYKGYTITLTDDNKVAYFVHDKYLFLTDNYDSACYILENHIYDKSESLFRQKGVQKILKNLDKNRLGTIIISDFKPGIAKLGTIAENKSRVSNLKRLTRELNVTGITVSLDKDILTLKSYSTFDISIMTNKLLLEKCKALLSFNSNNFDIKILPKNTLGYIYISDLSKFINIGLEISGFNHKDEYEQAKQLAEMFTSLNFEKDIIGLFDNKTMLTLVDTGYNRPGFLLLLSNKDNTNDIITKISKLISMQFPDSKFSKVNYKNYELTDISSKKLPSNLTFGPISKDYYCIGESNAVRTLFDKNENGLLQVESYKKISKYSLENPKVAMYFNNKIINEVQKNKVNNQINFNKVNEKIDSLLLNFCIEKNLIKGSLNIDIKE